MARKRKEWSFSNEIKESKVALMKNASMQEMIKLFNDGVAREASTPQSLSNKMALTLGVTRRCEVAVLIEKHSVEAWKRVHLVWRYVAFQHFVYIKRAEQLLSGFPGTARRGKLPIGDIDAYKANNIMMAAAFSATIGETEAAYWFGDKCLSWLSERPMFVDPKAWTFGMTEPFLLRLYILWRQLPIDLKDHGVTNYGPYQAVFDHWDSPEAMTKVVHDLCRLHAGKVVNRNEPDDDFVFGLQSGFYSEFPVEIFFLQRVRRELGLSVPDPEHPLLRSPLAKLPQPLPKSGRDPYLGQVYELCNKQMPDLVVPWETEYQAKPTNLTAFPELDVSS